jgi:hypothetical protein
MAGVGVMASRDAAQLRNGETPAVFAVVRYDAQPSITNGPIYTADGDGVILSGLFAINTTNTDAVIAVTVHRGVSGAVDPLVADVRVPAGTAGPVLRMGFMALGGILLQPGDSLHVSAEAAPPSALTNNQGGGG